MNLAAAKKMVHLVAQDIRSISEPHNPGCWFYPKVLSDSDCKRIEEEARLIPSNPKNARQGKFDEGMIDIEDFELYVRLPSVIYDISGMCIKRIRQEAGRDVCLRKIRLYWNDSIKTRPYHLDSIFPETWKAMIYLTDVEEKHGPYCYYPYSHRRSFQRYKNTFLNMFNGRREMDMFSLNGATPSVFTAKKGACILSSQAGIHRGMPQEKGCQRMVLVLVFS